MRLWVKGLCFHLPHPSTQTHTSSPTHAHTTCTRSNLAVSHEADGQWSRLSCQRKSMTHTTAFSQLTYTPQCPSPGTARMYQDDVGHVFLLPGKHIWHISIHTNHMVELNPQWKERHTNLFVKMYSRQQGSQITT